MNIRKMTIDDRISVAGFIAELNQEKKHYIGYCETTRSGVFAAFDRDLTESPPEKTFMIAYDEEKIAGVAGFDLDLSEGTAESWGPFITENYQESIGDLLWKTALENLPDDISTIFLFPSVENQYVQQVAFKRRARELGKHFIMDLKCQPGVSSDSSINEIHPSDTDEVVHLHQQSFPGTYLSGEKMVRLLDEEHRLFVKKDNGQFAGYIYIELDQVERDVSIEFFAVKENMRGRGIGSELIQYALMWLKNEGFHDIRLCVNAQNTSAIHLYEKNGFKKDVKLVHIELKR